MNLQRMHMEGARPSNKLRLSTKIIIKKKHTHNRTNGACMIRGHQIKSTHLDVSSVLLTVHDLGNGHDVLGQGTRLVGADARRRSQSLHTLEVLHQNLTYDSRTSFSFQTFNTYYEVRNIVMGGSTCLTIVLDSIVNQTAPSRGNRHAWREG